MTLEALKALETMASTGIPDSIKDIIAAREKIRITTEERFGSVSECVDKLPPGVVHRILPTDGHSFLYFIEGVIPEELPSRFKKMCCDGGGFAGHLEISTDSDDDIRDFVHAVIETIIVRITPLMNEGQCLELNFRGSPYPPVLFRKIVFQKLYFYKEIDVDESTSSRFSGSIGYNCEFKIVDREGSLYLSNVVHKKD